METESLKTPIIRTIDALYGAGAGEKVRSANVLVVGAGGVGCELLKNLACNGFTSITAIDLDIIDVSNLNRQFLFRRPHVGFSKAETAAHSIRTMAPGVNMRGLVANIKDPRFDVNYFKQFSIVCNALDNIEARRHVNRVCLAANVPLIESGSTGYNGQMSVHGGGYECYDCIEKLNKKTAIPVCTIRSTPDKPVHCIVWAKALWDLIFAPDDEGNVLADLDGGGGTSEENVSENGVINGNKEKPSLRKPAKRVRYSHPEEAEVFAERVCRRIFEDDIAEQAAMKDLWKDRAPPTTFDVPKCATAANDVDVEKVNLLEQRVWNRDECARILYSVLKRMVKERVKDIGDIPFDKDDRDALAFVVAAANLRADAYGVALSSPFDVKGVAGNIVHAIATTNAVVGGFVALEAVKIVVNDGNLDQCRPCTITTVPSGSRVRTVITTNKMQRPSPLCYVCSKGQLLLTLDTKETSLKMLVENVLMKELSVAEPSIHVTMGSDYNIVYECGVGLEEDEIEMYEANMSKSLDELQVFNGAQLSVGDMKQNLKCVIHIVHQSGCQYDKPITERFMLDGAKPLAKQESNVVSTGVKNKVNYDEVVNIDEEEEECVVVGDISVAQVQAGIVSLEVDDTEGKQVDMNGEPSKENVVVEYANGNTLKRKSASEELEGETQRPSKKVKESSPKARVDAS